jgi:hypothetical protein
MTISPGRGLRARLRAHGSHVFTIKAWTGTGPIRSIRGGLLMMTMVAVTPLMLFASGMALLRASDANQLPTAAAWITVAAVPVLIAIAAVVIVSIASEAMVMEWLFYLERLSRAYARGRYSLRPQRLHSAPLEFRILAEAVEEMADGVEHRDQALRDALQEQTVLLREVHHRVKNNLQIVGSLLSLQAARSTDPGAKEALQDAMVRIDAMSLSQRFMRQQEEADRVTSTELFQAFAAQIRARLGAGKRGLSLECDIEPRVLPLEVGSRLVAIAAEALICAFRSSDSPVLPCRLTVGFVGEIVTMAVSAPGKPLACGPAMISSDLIDGYVRQMRGRLEISETLGRLTVTADCPAMALLAAEPSAELADGLGPMQHPKFFKVSGRTHDGLES